MTEGALRKSEHLNQAEKTLVTVQGEYLCIGIPPCASFPEGVVFKLRFAHDVPATLKMGMVDCMKDIGDFICTMPELNNLPSETGRILVSKILKLMVENSFGEKLGSIESPMNIGETTTQIPILPGNLLVANKSFALGGKKYVNSIGDSVRYALVINNDGQFMATKDGFVYAIIDDVHGMESSYIKCASCGTSYLSGDTRNCTSCGAPN